MFTVIGLNVYLCIKAYTYIYQSFPNFSLSFFFKIYCSCFSPEFTEIANPNFCFLWFFQTLHSCIPLFIVKNNEIM